jgi:hypothetical protein
MRRSRSILSQTYYSAGSANTVVHFQLARFSAALLRDRVFENSLLRISRINGTNKSIVKRLTHQLLDLLREQIQILHFHSCVGNAFRYCL